jgi:UDP-N-acetylglucosamine diphosphorylase / glucose-1-phosphate thymidylyltransferase / UDP-N-acetylgalactosamine diphosphorylase / glucosamine-1-phosphate N-acetyltransferase / galactosamine-1-phosphate N-acetyltransferase
MIGDECVIGWGTEIRHALVLNRTRIPHFNGIYTSLIGNRVNMAGRSSTANYRLDGGEVVVRVPEEGRMKSYPTGQTLFGAIVGDDTNIGGDTLFQPGAIVGRRCIIYPQSCISGYIPHDSIVKPKAKLFEVYPVGRPL